MVAGSQGV